MPVAGRVPNLRGALVTSFIANMESGRDYHYYKERSQDVKLEDNSQRSL